MANILGLPPRPPPESDPSDPLIHLNSAGSDGRDGSKWIKWVTRGSAGSGKPKIFTLPAEAQEAPCADQSSGEATTGRGRNR
jgi:hypothetical protein